MLRSLACLSLVACFLPPAPTARGPRPTWSHDDEATRASIYRKYRLAAASAGWGTMLAREDGKHTYIDLRDVLGEYPRSRTLYERAASRDSTLATLLIGGITLAAVGGGDQLAHAIDGSQGLTQTGRDVMYACGGALVLSALVTSLVWRDPIPQIPATYNDELRADLGL